MARDHSIQFIEQTLSHAGLVRASQGNCLLPEAMANTRQPLPNWRKQCALVCNLPWPGPPIMGQKEQCATACRYNDDELRDLHERSNAGLSVNTNRSYKFHERQFWVSSVM